MKQTEKWGVLPLFLFITVGVLSGCGNDNDPVLPPEPGEAGKQTLEGIDSNNNGVRDDVERFIATTFPDSPELRTVLYQESRAVQTLLSVADKEDEQSFPDAALELAKPIRCALALEITNFDSASADVLGVMLNTKLRSDTYFKIDDMANGKIINSPSGEFIDSCDADLLEEERSR